PERLRSLRQKNHMTRKELDERSGIAERTIQRLENEPQLCQKTREDTVNRLAKALGVESGVLTGKLPLPESDKASASDSERVQISAQVAPKARLAYDLIKRRYGVSATEIINMAPLFFALLAEGSLAWRRKEIKEANETIGRLGQSNGFWRGGLSGAESYMNEGIAAEENSIDKADLFGERLFSDTSILMDDFFDPSTDNPFTSYLHELKAELDIPGVVDVGSGNLIFGSPLKFPDYNICRDELDGIAKGSDYAKMALETGHVRLSEIPEELMAEDAGEERAKWLEDRLPDIIKDLDKEIADILREFLQDPEGDYEKRIKKMAKELSPLATVVEKLGPLATYKEVLIRSGILDPEGDLRKRIEERTISIEELDRLLAGEPLEEADSQETNSDIEKEGDDQ
ncbi:MAG: helix-turn-helix transcriptional regulator, partial [Gemmatimonadetes bacterium]|nr:helix-turn-helix transcriptional regulator [Gemmatimonadota bacterium]